MGDRLRLGVVLGLGNQIAISSRVIIWQGVKNGQNTSVYTFNPTAHNSDQKEALVNPYKLKRTGKRPYEENQEQRQG